VVSSSVEYIYDGWRVIQERDGSNNPLVSYTRGNDLSGTLERAGGIGGLLARSHGYSSGDGSWSTHNFYFGDGNGNITYMLDSSQAMVAEYRYHPFGGTISSSGSLANANVYRFSSKEVHLNSGMYYYGFRFYDPNLQRWINTDPLGEPGFELTRRLRNPLRVTFSAPNLYQFVGNRPVGFIDSRGLEIGPTLPAPNPLGGLPGMSACAAILNQIEALSDQLLARPNDPALSAAIAGLYALYDSMCMPPPPQPPRNPGPNCPIIIFGTAPRQPSPTSPNKQPDGTDPVWVVIAVDIDVIIGELWPVVIAL
jgi:RHS repeat-associated protein